MLLFAVNLFVYFKGGQNNINITQCLIADIFTSNEISPNPNDDGVEHFLILKIGKMLLLKTQELKQLYLQAWILLLVIIQVDHVIMIFRVRKLLYQNIQDRSRLYHSQFKKVRRFK